MNRRQIVLGVCLMAIGGTLVHFLESTAPAADDAPNALAVRYAEARLRVAELRLQRANELNQKVPGTLAEGMVALFASDVEFAKEQLQSAKNSQAGDALAAFLRREELSLKLAQANLNRSIEQNRRAPDLIPASDVERMKLAVEMTQMRLQIGKSLSNAPAEEKLRFQVEMLADSLDQVKDQTNLLGQNRISQFY